MKGEETNMNCQRPTPEEKNSGYNRFLTAKKEL